MSSNLTKGSQYGLLMETRTVVPLGELCDSNTGIQTGPFGSQLHSSDYVQQGTPIITVENLNENYITGDSIPLVSDEDANRLIKYTLKPGDIVFSRVGSVDRRALVTEKEDRWLFSGRILRIRTNPDLIDSTYLSYFFGLSKFKDYIRQIAVGATMPSLNTNIMTSLPIVVPPLGEQHAIGLILRQVDEKIRLNRQIALTLEQIAQTIFKSWFIDFTPVHAKSRGERPLGMDAETAALFPDSFEESELGLIPAGWEVRALSEFAQVPIGGLWGSDEESQSADFRYLCLRGVDMDDLKANATANRIPLRWSKKTNVDKRQLSNCDVLIGASGAGPVGKSMLWDSSIGGMFHENVIFSNFVKRFKTDNESFATFLWQKLDLMYQTGEIFTFVNGTSVPNIQDAELLSATKVAVPPSELLSKQNDFVRNYLRMKFTGENATLERIRDSILPRLISGELEIPAELLEA